MTRKRYKAEEILGKLRQAEVLIGRGRSDAEVCREIEVTEVTYFRWRKEYGGLKLDQARKLKDLENENARLKRSVAELTLDKQILQEALQGS
jgi:transposase-like protein